MMNGTTPHVDQVADQADPAHPLAGFEHLAAEAAALEGGPPIPGSAEAAHTESAQLALNTDELEQALQLARLMVAPMFAWWPKFADTWNDRALRGIAAGGSAVMVKHGWSMGDLFNTYGPYVALAGATLPPALVTYAAIKEQKQLAARQSQQATNVRTGEAANGSDRQAPH